MTTRAAWLVVGGALAAPLITWLPMLALRFPNSGMPLYEPAQGIDFWQSQLVWLLALSALALWIAQSDRWLAATVLLLGAMIFYRGGRLDPTHSILFAVGAGALMLARRIPRAYHARVIGLVAASGIFQIIYALQQAYLQYDLLWGPLVLPGARLIAQPQPLGTLGTVDALGAYVAITAPLMPWWALPFAALTIWTSHSIGATAAFGIGLAVRYRHLVPWLWLQIVGVLAGAGGALYFAVWIKGPQSLAVRAAIWSFGLQYTEHTDPILGLGLGGWSRHIPTAQAQMNFLPSKELFREAHNDYVQWAVELGIVGVLLAGLWLWSHRAMFRDARVGASLAALAVSATGFFPFHVVSTALLSIILVGLATPDQDAGAVTV